MGDRFTGPGGRGRVAQIDGYGTTIQRIGRFGPEYAP